MLKFLNMLKNRLKENFNTFKYKTYKYYTYIYTQLNNKTNNIMKVIGYQIESRNGKQEIPKELYSFEVFKTIELAENFILTDISENPENKYKWTITIVFEDTIEEPTILEYF